ncbi:MAG: hypothetical protein IT236_08325, partial [Bacteroidia bacterium]|nr:hypothetical protein [Bacteroidia bacterium]
MPDTITINKLFARALEIENIDLDSSLLLTQKAYLLSQKINYQRGIGLAFMRLGVAAKIKGKNDSALIYLREALSIRRRLKHDGYEANTLKTLSSVFHAKGNR